MAVPRAVAAPLRYFVHRFLTYGWRQEGLTSAAKPDSYIRDGKRGSAAASRQIWRTNRDDGAPLRIRHQPVADSPTGHPLFFKTQRTFRPVDEQWGRLREHITNSAACEASAWWPSSGFGRSRPARGSARIREPQPSLAQPQRRAGQRQLAAAPLPRRQPLGLPFDRIRREVRPPSALPTTGRPAGAGRAP